MSILDIYYRGFKDFRSNTQEDKNCEKDRRIFKKSGVEFDKLTITKYLCTINDDWIIEIEKGLEFVEKAVKEERQFITVNGEIVPIEKAKKVSKDTVAHLARHANMITRKPEPGKDLIPDKLYMVEKLSDFAVYENRFLYMLLCYLRDFVALRIEKIQKLRSTYTCHLKLKKDLNTKKRKFNFDTEFVEERFDNPYPIPDPVCEELLQRILDIQQIVQMLLNTNLMVEVAKAPMLKPPITKTNVLKMNNNFKNSLALYNYVVDYKGDGFTSEEVVKDFAPLGDATADELAEIGTLTAFLTYKMGNEIEDKLEAIYQQEEERKKKEEALKLVEQIKRLKRRVAESGMDIEEYMVLLEKRNRELEADSLKLLEYKNEILELNNRIDDLNREKDELNRRIDELCKEIEDLMNEIARLNQKYIDDMAALKAAHAEEIRLLKEEHENEIQALNEEHQNEIDDLIKRHEENIEYINSVHQQELQSLADDYEELIISIKEELALERNQIISSYEAKLDAINQEIEKKTIAHNNLVQSYGEKITALNNDIVELNTKREELINSYEAKLMDMKNTYASDYNALVIETDEIKNNLQGKNDELSNKNYLLLAELDALRVETGRLTPTLDYTSKERFTELEREFIAFSNFFKDQWELTKKEIRKELLWSKEEYQRVREREKEIKKEKALAKKKPNAEEENIEE